MRKGRRRRWRSRRRRGGVWLRGEFYMYIGVGGVGADEGVVWRLCVVVGCVGRRASAVLTAWIAVVRAVDGCA